MCTKVLKRTVACCLLMGLVFMLLTSASAGAEGLFPTLSQLFGTAMPSIGRALDRSADESVETEGGKCEVYRDFTYDDYYAFGVYLAGTGAVLDSSIVTVNAIAVKISVRGACMQFTYDWFTRTATAEYPSGTRDEPEKENVEPALCLLPRVGGMMPSARFALDRAPDSEEAGNDGITQIWTNVNDPDYSAFSAYLAQNGAVLGNTSIEAGALTADIWLNDYLFTVKYDVHSKTLRVSYPAGTSPEREKWNEIRGYGFLLPKLTVPSLGEALRRYPDMEMQNEDGSRTEVYRHVSADEFSAYSVYLIGLDAVMTDYQTKGSVFSALLQLEGQTFSFSYDSLALEARLTYPPDTYDMWLESAKIRLQAAKDLMAGGEYKEALRELHRIPSWRDYTPVAELVANDENLQAAAVAAQAALEAKYAVGNYVTFGIYPQTAAGNDSTPIEWLVLDYDAANNQALLISRYGLDAKPYNEKGVDITWEKCTLRAWLNGAFLNKAFTAQEQAGIVLASVDNSSSQGYSEWSTSGGNDTQDRVFLLSYTEVNKYLGVTYNNTKNTKSRVAPTAYAIEQGAYTSSSDKTADGTAAGWWWLRSPGLNQHGAAYVGIRGSLSSSSVSDGRAVVRPALWINLESDIF